MLVGHVGAAFIAKGLQPRLSLGTAILATLLADVLLFVFVLAGLEHVAFRTSAAPAPYFTAIDIGVSHSVTMTILWAAAVAFTCAWLARDRGVAAAAAALVVSHMVLDVVSVRPGLPVSPRHVAYIGWTLPLDPASLLLLTMVFEGVLWIGAVVLYVAASRSTNSAGRYVFWGGVVSWTLAWYLNVTRVPPIKQEDGSIEGLILLVLLIGWGYWMNRARATKDATYAVQST